MGRTRHKPPGILATVISAAAENIAPGTGWVFAAELCWNLVQHNKATTYEARHETTELQRHYKV